MNSDVFKIAGVSIPKGKSKSIKLKVSETYTGDSVYMRMKVLRALEPGPTVLITAAIHGDELNGTGIIHDLIFEDSLELKAGNVVLLPVVNIFGFENHERYLPDRRDLNRGFPGIEKGSITSRLAYSLMTEVVEKCDYCIDLHTAAVQRTNYPNIRVDLSNKEASRIAKVFGCTLILDGKGPEGSFRREACKIGCPTIVLEAGEPAKIEPSVLRIGVSGIKNVLSDLGMIEHNAVTPPYQAIIRKTKWVRADIGGILKFHVAPGDFIEVGQALAAIYSIMGKRQRTIKSADSGIVMGLVTMPAVKPGEPICHIAIPNSKILNLKKKMTAGFGTGMHSKVQRDLATNVHVIKENLTDKQ